MLYIQKETEVKKLLIASLCTIGLSACSSDPDFDLNVSMGADPIFGTPYEMILITAKDDEVELEEVVVNRGNCEVNTKELPVTLGYGEARRFGVRADECDVRAVEVTTSRGSWTEEFTGY